MEWRDATLSAHVNPGWVPLVDELHRRLLEIDPEIVVEQVKEKFGALRFYVAVSDPGLVPEEVHKGGFNYDNDKETLGEIVQWVISQAETVSMWICEVCGKPGSCGSHGQNWLNTLCLEHSKRRRETGDPAWMMAEEQIKSRILDAQKEKT